MDDNTPLDKLIKTFVLKGKRELELKNEMKRSKFTGGLNHKWDTVLDMGFVKFLPE